MPYQIDEYEPIPFPWANLFLIGAAFFFGVGIGQILC